MLFGHLPSPIHAAQTHLMAISNIERSISMLTLIMENPSSTVSLSNA